MNFQTWIEQKKVKEHDLIFLGPLKASGHRDLFTRIADRMAALNPSFADGLAFLEQITDLLLMDRTEGLLPHPGAPAGENSVRTFTIWKEAVYRLRFPQTALRDDQLKARWAGFSWPSGSRTRFERRGDRAGVELRVFISSPADITRLVAALERVRKDMNS